MKKLRWQLIIIFLTGLVVGVLLLGEQPAAQPNQAPQPVRGGIYTEALVGAMQRLNPILDYNNSVDHDINRLIFSGLLRFDDRGLAQLDMAESYGISKDGTLYNFTLQKGMHWQDGKPVTTDDVLFTIDLLRKGGAIVPADLQALWKDVKAVRLSDTTLQFQLPEPYAPFLDYLTFGILPKHLLSNLTFDQVASAPFNLKPVGSGPYRFDHLMVENGQITGLVLMAWDQYYGKKPYVEQIVFRFYADGTSALQAYNDGAVQGISEVTPDILQASLAETNLSIYTGRKPQLAMVLFNLKNQDKTFLQDADVRRALFMGINRQRIINQLLDGQAVLANGPILPGTWAYYDGLQAQDFDPEGARNLLKQAGFVLATETDTVRSKDKVALNFTLLYPNDDLHKSIAAAIQQDWASLNVQVDLEAVPYDQMINDRLGQRSYDAALVDLNLSRTPDPDPYPFWDQAQAATGQNYTQWDSRVASEYLEQARIEVDLAERTRLYRDFQVVFDEDLPAIPLYYPVYSYAVDKGVQGVRMGPLFDTSDRFDTILEWFFAVKRSTSAPTLTPGK